MNCEKCQELLSDYLDGVLGHRERAALAAHLGACPACAEVREELRSIVVAARATREHTVAPPDERALWLRIREAVEHEEGFIPVAATAAAVPSRPRAGFWTRLLDRRWEFSLPQLASGVAALAVAVAFVTTLGVQYISNERDGQDSVRPRPAGRDAALTSFRPQTYLQPHQANLQYWQQRVEQRKATWNPRMRESFDRSVSVLDEAMTESMGELERNPHDEVAEQMLNAALRDKIELLREFGEQ